MPGKRPLYDGDHYEVCESVGFQLFNLMTLMRREVGIRMAAHGLTDAQWRPLWMLKIGRATTAVELARELDIDAGAMPRLVDRLEAKGLVDRLRSDTDRRVVRLRLTAGGESVVAQVPQVLAAVNNDFLDGFSGDEWNHLRQFMERMAANGLALQAQRATA